MFDHPKTSLEDFTDQKEIEVERTRHLEPV